MADFRQKTLVSFLVILLAAVQTGCWDRKELEEQAFVTTIAIDKGRSPGTFLWSMRIASPPSLAGGTTGVSSTTKGTSSMVTVEAPTVFGAVNLLNTFIGRKINLMHTKIIIVAEDVAKKDPYPLRTFIRYREIRRSVFVGVVKGRAIDILKRNQPVLERNPSKYAETLILSTTFTGLVPMTQIHDFLINSESGGITATAILLGLSHGLKQPAVSTEKATAPYLPGQIPREGDTPVEFIGAAVFKGGKMVGEINGSENRGMAMLTGRFMRAFSSIPDPREAKKAVSLDLRAAAPPVVKVRIRNGRPEISAKVSLEAEILAIQSAQDYTTGPGLKALEKASARYYEKKLLALVKKTQAMRADIFGFGNKARHLVGTVDEWNKLDWDDLYPKAEVRISVQVAIRRIGMQIQPATPID